MFTDIVGYTALMAKNEKRAFEILKQNLLIHASAINEFHGTLVKELGDGILASFPTVSDALNAAISIQKQCNETGEFKVRIGIHQGEVVFEKEDIFGDAVNVASRIQTLGTPGSVLFSDKVADEIKNKAEFKVIKLGRFELKNVAEPIEVFALGNDGIPVPKRSEIQGKLMRPRLAVSISIILVLILAGYVALNYEELLPAGEEKSIVVMPFEFKASESESGFKFLADGFHSEIISRLYLQKNLLVIAPEAANQAQKAKWATAEIHDRLNVQYVLSGTIQKDGNRLQISTQLTDARTGAVLDTKTLERKVDDYFQLQQEVAIKVVRDVGLVVSKGLETYRTTENLKALEFYHTALEYPTRSQKERDTVIWLLHRSLQEDSMNLQPLAYLVNIHVFRYDVESDTLQLKAGVQALERMIRIDKSSMITQHSQSVYSYYVLKNYALVIEQLDAILRRSPYYVPAINRKTLAYRRWGKYQESINTYSVLAKANPLVHQSLDFNTIFGYTVLRHGQTREAYGYIRKLRNTPSVKDYFVLSFNHAVLEGRWDKLDSLVNEAEQSGFKLFGPDQQEELVFCKEQLQAFYKRQYQTNLQLFKKHDISWMNQYDTACMAMDSATFLLLLGDSAASRIAFHNASTREEDRHQRIKGSQYGDDAWINYTICRAALGEPGWKEEFARIKSQLVGLYYPKYYNGYVTACLLSGENEMAMKLLTEWKDENIPYQIDNSYMSPGQQLLKDHPLLDPIRNKPGFEELWEGNHLKLKPLNIPKELVPR